ncbi:MAG: cbb3-type cytochrome c oxidase subunit I [bacterium]
MPTTQSFTEYDYSVAKGFVLSALLWGVVGMSVGLTLAFELIFPELNANLPWLTFNRLRPLHTNAVIFGFTLAGIFASWYYVSQRVLKVRMVLPVLAKAHLVLFNLIIVLAAYTLLAGHSTSKEYHELPWWLDVVIVVMWLMWGGHMFAMLGARKEKTLYVSLWYFMA